MVPPCLLTISELIHSPRPVPVSPFVLTNGSKSVFLISGSIPDPVSAMVKRMPGREPFLCSRVLVTRIFSLPPCPHCVQSISDQVQDQLAEFSSPGDKGRAFAEISLNHDFSRVQSRLIEHQSGVHDLGDLHDDRTDRFPVKPESLGDDFRYSRQLSSAISPYLFDSSSEDELPMR